MNENRGRKQWVWPAAFFLLNLAAIVCWFAWYGDIAGRELAVTAMTPSGSGVDAGGVTEIKLVFNLPLDPDTVKKDTIRLVPPIGGKTELTGDDTLRFLPHEPLSPATGYTVILSPGIRGSRGEPPPKDLLEFFTTRFRLESAAPASFDNNSRTVELVFNQPIAASELERAIQVKTTEPDSGDRELVSVVGNASSRKQRLIINTNRSSFVLFTLPAGLTGSSGPLGLEEEKRILWRIIGPGEDYSMRKPEWAAELEAVELAPEVAFLGMSADWDDGAGIVAVRATTPLDPAEAPKYVKVSPEIPLTFSGTYGGLRIMGDFKPGRQYRVTLEKGFPAGYAGSLPETITRQVWFDDLPPSVNFTYGGGFLSPQGMLKVPVMTRNVAEFKLGVQKLYSTNLVEALLRDYGEEVGSDYTQPEIVETIRPGGARNQEKETLLDLPGLVGEAPLGVYGLEVWQENRRWNGRNALIAVSDLGLSCRQGRDEMFAWATSIREGTPRPGIRVRLYSTKRRLLSQAVTGDDGVARMAIPPTAGDEKPALLLGEADHDECSFVRLDKDRKPAPAAARRGSAYAKEYQVFLTAERGVYRGGEKVRLAGLVRDENVATVPDLPLEIIVFGPDGKRSGHYRAKADAAGRLALEAPLGESYPSGIYTAEAKLPGQDDTLGQAWFRVADYMPETLSIDMNLEGKKPESGENHLDIAVSRLAGGELGPIPVKVQVSYSPAPFAPDGWDDWDFGDARRSGAADSREREVLLDEKGHGATTWKNPALPHPAATLMTVRAEAAEDGGRTVGASVSRLVHDVPYFIGVKRPKHPAKAGEAFPLPLAAVRPDGEVLELDGDWSGQLFRVEYTGLLKKNTSGRLVYEWVRQEIPEAKLSGIWKKGRSEAWPIPVSGGSYRLVVDSAEGRGCALDFSVEGPGDSWHGEDPEMLAITLDKDEYSVGERATASTLAPFAGIALITVETDEVLSHWLMEFKQGENSFVVPVNEPMRPNAFVSATLIRPAQAEAEWKPHRLSGTVRLKVDNRDRRLAVDLAAGDSFTPGKPVTVGIKVNLDGKPVEKAAVVLWAVDEGVLSLTGYKSVSPWEIFYQARRVGVREADMYSRLAPELSEWLAAKQASPGGSDHHNEFARRLNPIFAGRVKPAVLFQADLETNDQGEVETTLAIPQFAGRLRLMCWAAADRSMGAAEKEIEVKAPVSVNAVWPRFAAPGDEFDLPITVLNRSGKDGVAVIECKGDDHLEFEFQSVAVKMPGTPAPSGNRGRAQSFAEEIAIPNEVRNNQASRLFIRTRAVKAGVAKASVTATLNGESFTEEMELSIRPPILFSREAGNLTVAPGEKKEFALAEQLIPENAKVKLLAGGNPQIGLTGSMESLLDYPYGCAEQTAAKLLGLAYLPDLLALSRPGQLESGETARLATACIERLSTMQTANGSLKMWPGPGEGLFWVSAQALFTLAETRAAGHAIPQRLIDDMASYLNDRIDSLLGEEKLERDGGEKVALAMLALAKTDKLTRSWLLRFAEIADEHAANDKPLASSALAFLCEAVALAGDMETAHGLWQSYNPSGEKPGKAGNRIIDLSAWLMAAMAVGDEGKHELAAELGLMSHDGFINWSTRENSLAMAALGRYWQGADPVPDESIAAKINGKNETIPLRRGGLWDNLPGESRIEVDNASSGTLRLFWLSEGTPLSGSVPEEDKGLIARRRIHRLDGSELRSPYLLTQGEVYEIRLGVSGTADDLAIVDMLPAGLEIENAGLKGRPLDGDAAQGLRVANVEIRDDRLLVFASVEGAGEYRYLVRAVSSGTFALPALDVSSMYDTTRRSVSGSGGIKIVGGKEAANDR